MNYVIIILAVLVISFFSILIQYKLRIHRMKSALNESVSKGKVYKFGLQRTLILAFVFWFTFCLVGFASYSPYLIRNTEKIPVLIILAVFFVIFVLCLKWFFSIYGSYVEIFDDSIIINYKRQGVFTYHFNDITKYSITNSHIRLTKCDDEYEFENLFEKYELLILVMNSRCRQLPE